MAWVLDYRPEFFRALFFFIFFCVFHWTACQPIVGGWLRLPRLWWGTFLIGLLQSNALESAKYLGHFVSASGPSSGKRWDQTSELLEMLEVRLVDILLSMMRQYFNMLVMVHNRRTTFESKYRGMILYFWPYLHASFSFLMELGLTGHLEFFRKFIGSGDVTRPLVEFTKVWWEWLTVRPYHWMVGWTDIC